MPALIFAILKRVRPSSTKQAFFRIFLLTIAVLFGIIILYRIMKFECAAKIRRMKGMSRI